MAGWLATHLALQVLSPVLCHAVLGVAGHALLQLVLLLLQLQTLLFSSCELWWQTKDKRYSKQVVAADICAVIYSISDSSTHHTRIPQHTG